MKKIICSMYAPLLVNEALPIYCGHRPAEKWSPNIVRFRWKQVNSARPKKKLFRIRQKRMQSERKAKLEWLKNQTKRTTIWKWKETKKSRNRERRGKRRRFGRKIKRNWNNEQAWRKQKSKQIRRSINYSDNRLSFDVFSNLRTRIRLHTFNPILHRTRTHRFDLTCRTRRTMQDRAMRVRMLMKKIMMIGSASLHSIHK